MGILSPSINITPSENEVYQHLLYVSRMILLGSLLLLLLGAALCLVCTSILEDQLESKAATNTISLRMAVSGVFVGVVLFSGSALFVLGTVMLFTVGK